MADIHILLLVHIVTLSSCVCVNVDGYTCTDVYVCRAHRGESVSVTWTIDSCSDKPAISILNPDNDLIVSFMQNQPTTEKSGIMPYTKDCSFGFTILRADLDHAGTYTMARGGRRSHAELFIYAAPPQAALEVHGSEATCRVWSLSKPYRLKPTLVYTWNISTQSQLKLTDEPTITLPPTHFQLSCQGREEGSRFQSPPSQWIQVFNSISTFTTQRYDSTTQQFTSVVEYQSHKSTLQQIASISTAWQTSYKPKPTDEYITIFSLPMLVSTATTVIALVIIIIFAILMINTFGCKRRTIKLQKCDEDLNLDSISPRPGTSTMEPTDRNTESPSTCVHINIARLHKHDVGISLDSMTPGTPTPGPSTMQCSDSSSESQSMDGPINIPPTAAAAAENPAVRRPGSVNSAVSEDDDSYEHPYDTIEDPYEGLYDDVNPNARRRDYERLPRVETETNDTNDGNSASADADNVTTDPQNLDINVNTQ